MEKPRQKWAMACPSPKGRRKVIKRDWHGWVCGRVCVCTGDYPTWPHPYLVHVQNLWLSAQDQGTGGKGQRMGESPPPMCPHPSLPRPLLTAWSRSVSSLRRFLHLAAANLLRSRRTLLFSSSSGVS